MKKRWICLLTAVMLSAGVCMAEPVASDAAPLEEDAGGFVAGKCSLIVNPEDPDKAEADRFGEDLKEAEVVIDLYQVAKAVKVKGYDTYSYQVNPDYGLSIPEYPEGGDWEKLAQQAAEAAIKKGDASDTLVKSGVPAGEKADLDAGLYLVIARGSSLTDAEDYLTEITQKEEETGDETTTYATVAYSKKNAYLFAPQLISLPTKEADADGVINTANPGDWIYDLSVNLKPEQTARFGSLEIVKTLSTYETEEGIQEPVTCVFEVTGTLGEETVYSNVESITFTAAGQESAVLDRIPAGASVTVREVYSGSSYELTVPGDRSTVIAADDVVSVNFENTYTREQKKGHGIKNQFVYDENGRWQWYSDPPQDADGNQGLPEAAAR